MGEVIDKDLNKIETNMNIGYILKIIRLIIVIFNISFFMGIFWLVLCKLKEDIKHWEHTEELQSFIEAYSFDERSEMFQVVSSMYFSFTSLSTVGFGDFNPKSDIERLITCVLLLFGVAIFSYIMGDFIEMLNKYKELNAELDDGDSLPLSRVGSLREHSQQKLLAGLEGTVPFVDHR